jgi:hypothetical protein
MLRKKTKEDCIEKGIRYIKRNPDLSFEFNLKTVMPGQHIATAIASAVNEAAEYLEDAIDNDYNHSGASFNYCVAQVIEKAEKNLGYQVTETDKEEDGNIRKIIVISPPA